METLVLKKKFLLQLVDLLVQLHQLDYTIQHWLILESSLKSYKAKLAIEFKDSGCGVAEADLKAEASQDYTDAKSAFINARAESMKAKVNYFAAQEYFKMYTELEKSERFSAKYQT